MSAVDRPSMPTGYGIATDDAGRLPWGWVESRLTSARNYWVATTRADGRAHVMPVWGLWLDGGLLFSTDPKSTKARNLARQPNLAVHLESGDEVVVLEGVAERLSAAELPTAFVDVYETKYGHRVDIANPAFAFYRLQPLVVLAWQEADFPSSATRFRLDR